MRVGNIHGAGTGGGVTMARVPYMGMSGPLAKKWLERGKKVLVMFGLVEYF
jgi:hypothetical protein